MKKPKSSILKGLRRCFQKAVFLEKHQTSDLSIFQEQEAAYDSSRRRFIKNSMNQAVGLGLGSMYLSSCKTMFTKNTASNLNPRIAIVGGGIAGLHCGYVLQKAGIHSMIYEGSNRLGGRIFTKSNVFGDNLTTEFGGELIDSSHADMFALIREFGIETFDTFEDYKDGQIVKDTFFVKGKFYSEAAVIEEFRHIANKIEADTQGLGENYETPLCKKIDNISLEEYIK